MSAHAWAEVGAVVFVVCAAGLWASVLSFDPGRSARAAERAREEARAARMATYKPMPGAPWLKDDAGEADPTPRR